MGLFWEREGPHYGPQIGAVLRMRGPSTDLKWGWFCELGPPARSSHGAGSGNEGPQ